MPEPTELEILAAVRDLIAVHTSEEIVSTTLSAARTVVHTDAAFWMDADGDGLRMTAVAGIARPEVHLLSQIALDRGIGGEVLRSGDPATSADYPHDDRRIPDLAERIRGEDLSGVAAIPVRGESDVEAVLYVLSREPRIFDEAEIRALGAIAGAARALRHKALQREALVVQADALLSRAQRAERQHIAVAALTTAMLEGTGVEQAIAAAGERLGITLALTGLPQPDEQDPERFMPLAVNPPPVGRSLPVPGAGAATLTAANADSISDDTLRLIALVIGLDFARRRASVETELRLADQFVRALLDGSKDELARVWHRASLIGFDLLVPRLPIAIGGEKPITRRLLDRINRETHARSSRAQVTTYEGEVIILWPTQDSEDRDALPRNVRQILEACWPERLAAGIGPICNDRDDYPDAVREALFARQLADHAAIRSIVTSEELGMYRLFAHAGGVHALRAAVHQTLGPLLDAETGDHSGLLETLRVYLENDRRLAVSARVLHLHVNTLRYRIDRIASLLSVDLDDPEVRFFLMLSLRLSPVIGRGA